MLWDSVTSMLEQPQSANKLSMFSVVVRRCGSYTIWKTAGQFGITGTEITPIEMIWVCLKMGYTPNEIAI